MKLLLLHDNILTRGANMNQKTIISCMGVVTYINNEKIYVALLKDKDNNWLLPKGHFKEGEGFVETAISKVTYQEQKEVLQKVSKYI